MENENQQSSSSSSSASIDATVQEEKLTQEQEKIVKNSIKQSIDLNRIEELLSHNNLEFEFEEIRYRVRKLTYKEKQSAYEKQVEKVTELLTNSKYDMEEVLREKYKKKGVDIDIMDKQIMTLETKKHQYQLKLGELLTKQAKDRDLEVFRNEISRINEEQVGISIRKTNLLQYSVEQQALIYVYAYLTFLITEKYENEVWVKAFNTYDDFMNSSEELINKASAHATLIIGKV
jgi:hypothetical protein